MVSLIIRWQLTFDFNRVNLIDNAILMSYFMFDFFLRLDKYLNSIIVSILEIHERRLSESYA
jgi:hypothetical protein